jgi:hypothetical protein
MIRKMKILSHFLNNHKINLYLKLYKIITNKMIRISKMMTKIFKIGNTMIINSIKIKN